MISFLKLYVPFKLKSKSINICHTLQKGNMHNTTQHKAIKSARNKIGLSSELFYEFFPQIVL